MSDNEYIDIDDVPSFQNLPAKSEFKPCPFCGREPEAMKYTPPFGAGKFDKIAQCPGCGAFLNAVKWQKRPIEDALRAEVARLTEALERERWVSVSERLPDEDQEVICMTTRESLHTRCIRTYFSDGEFYTPWSSDIVTHWRPLPEPPEGAR
jgi:hypothetical protein